MFFTKQKNFCCLKKIKKDIDNKKDFDSLVDALEIKAIVLEFIALHIYANKLLICCVLFLSFFENRIICQMHFESEQVR